MTVRVEQPLDHWFWFEFLNHLYIPLGSLLIPSDAYPTIVLGKSKFVAQNGMIGMLFVVVIWLDYSMLYDILIGIGLGCTPSMFQCLQCLQVFSSLGCSRQMFGLLRSRWFAIYPTKDLQQWRFQRQSGDQKTTWGPGHRTSKDCQTTNHLSWFFVEDRSRDGAIMKI
jgi:hypothetical protein